MCVYCFSNGVGRYLALSWGQTPWWLNDTPSVSFFDLGGAALFAPHPRYATDHYTICLLCAVRNWCREIRGRVAFINVWIVGSTVGLPPPRASINYFVWCEKSCLRCTHEENTIAILQNTTFLCRMDNDRQQFPSVLTGIKKTFTFQGKELLPSKGELILCILSVGYCSRLPCSPGHSQWHKTRRHYGIKPDPACCCLK